MICIVGDDQDLSAAYVAWLAERRGTEVRMLAEHAIGVSWWFEVDASGSGLVIEDRRIPIASVSGAFVRLNPRPPVPPSLGVPVEGEGVFAVERRNGLQWWLQTAPFCVVNRPTAGRSNGSKPYQMARLSDLGCDVPAWMATNDPFAARRFVERHGDGAVYKACSGLRSHVRMADAELLGRLAEGTAPVLLQRYVRGTEVRLHVVGGRTFATEIRSPSVDYRWSSEPPDYLPIRPPEHIRSLALRVAEAEQLPLAGIDFRVDAEGRWWWLEVNPVPTFLPYEAATGHPIGDAILDLLTPIRGVEGPSPLLTSTG